MIRVEVMVCLMLRGMNRNDIWLAPHVVTLGRDNFGLMENEAMAIGTVVRGSTGGGTFGALCKSARM